VVRWTSALVISALVATVTRADDLNSPDALKSELGEVNRQVREGQRSKALELARGLAE